VHQLVRGKQREDHPWAAGCAWTCPRRRRPARLVRMTLNQRSGGPYRDACDAPSLGHNRPHAVGFPIRCWHRYPRRRPIPTCAQSAPSGLSNSSKSLSPNMGLLREAEPPYTPFVCGVCRGDAGVAAGGLAHAGARAFSAFSAALTELARSTSARTANAGAPPPFRGRPAPRRSWTPAPGPTARRARGSGATRRPTGRPTHG